MRSFSRRPTHTTETITFLQTTYVGGEYTYNKIFTKRPLLWSVTAIEYQFSNWPQRKGSMVVDRSMCPMYGRPNSKQAPWFPFKFNLHTQLSVQQKAKSRLMKRSLGKWLVSWEALTIQAVVKISPSLWLVIVSLQWMDRRGHHLLGTYWCKQKGTI